MGIRTTPDRLATLIDTDPADPVHGCWIWKGWKSPKGYGWVQVNRAKWPVHRLVYELVVGPVPEGMVMDHLCRTPACVNPRHLEPVTNRENIMRGVVPSANRQRCKADEHELSVVGIYVDSDGYERCAECRRESRRRYALRRRAVAA